MTKSSLAKNMLALVVGLLLVSGIAYARYRYDVWFVRHVIEAVEE